MNAINRHRSALRLPLVAGALLACTTVVSAGTNPWAVQASRERQAERRAERTVERREERAQPVREASPPRAENRGNAAPSPRRNDGAAANRPSPPRDNANRPNPSRENAGRNNAGRYDGPRFARDNARGNDRPASRPPQQGQWQTRNDRGRDYRPPARDYRPAPPRNNYRPIPPRRYVPSLPTGYARYNWNGRPYYYYSGHWYRPWGSQFAIVTAPVGLFVSYLPSYHTSFWYGSSRYFFADDTYYLYEPARRGYVVTRSPYGDAGSVEDEATFDDDELYVYPARGQSEQQQADDRYECHSWAVGETGYDPVQGNYDPDRRADYLRAMSACLTGRGYTVR